MAVKNKSADPASMEEVEAVIIHKAEDTPAEMSSEKATPKETATGAGFCCYIGPTILGVIQSGTIYPGSRDAAIAAIAPAVEKYPLISSLMVDGKTLPADRIKVKTPGNLLFLNYKKLAAGKK